MSWMQCLSVLHDWGAGGGEQLCCKEAERPDSRRSGQRLRAHSRRQAASTLVCLHLVQYQGWEGKRETEWEGEWWGRELEKRRREEKERGEMKPVFPPGHCSTPPAHLPPAPRATASPGTHDPARDTGFAAAPPCAAVGQFWAEVPHFLTS